MRSYAFLIALANLVVILLALIWAGADRNNPAAPAVIGLLAFNMAAGWLLVAGYRRDADGRASWSARPALGALLLGILIVGSAFLQR